MSVIVKGMEMPTTCRECVIGNPKAKTCIIGKPKMNTKRRDDCPLIEVKEPHGDLVDRGWVRDSINNSCWLEHNDYLEAIGIIDDAPAVIEAEGREE